MKTTFKVFELSESQLLTEAHLGSTGLTSETIYGQTILEQVYESESRFDCLSWIHRQTSAAAKPREFEIKEIFTINV